MVRVVKEGVDPLSTEGSRRFGGRYNVAGEAATLYASLQAQTAVAEVARNAATPLSAQWWMYTLRVDLTALDLTDETVVTQLGLSTEMLVGEDKTETRRLAREARQSGFQAMIVPSAAAAGQKNVVLFLDVAEKMPEVVASQPVESSS